MAYEDSAKLYTDPLFQGRLQAAILREARGKPDSSVAAAALRNPSSGLWAFLPYVTSEPGFDVANSQVTDGMLLGAVQAVWAQVDANWQP